MPTEKIGCVLESRVPETMMLELDTLMADPKRWPKTVWGILAPKALTPAAQRWGATEVGFNFLRDQGYEFTRVEVMRHYRLHVPIMASSIDELGALAMEIRGGHATPYRGAQAVVGLYDKAIALGIRSLDLLDARLEKQRLKDQDPDPGLLMAMAELGAKLATSAATLALRGGSPMGREDDPWDGAREPIGPRVGHGRMRVIEGELRHIKDEGPADRADYSEKAAAEGRVDPFR